MPCSLFLPLPNNWKYPIVHIPSNSILKFSTCTHLQEISALAINPHTTLKESYVLPLRITHRISLKWNQMHQHIFQLRGQRNSPFSPPSIRREQLMTVISTSLDQFQCLVPSFIAGVLGHLKRKLLIQLSQDFCHRHTYMDSTNYLYLSSLTSPLPNGLVILLSIVLHNSFRLL